VEEPSTASIGDMAVFGSVLFDPHAVLEYLHGAAGVYAASWRGGPRLASYDGPADAVIE
jgi:hypothetical protein